MKVDGIMAENQEDRSDVHKNEVPGLIGTISYMAEIIDAASCAYAVLGTPEISKPFFDNEKIQEWRGSTSTDERKIIATEAKRILSSEGEVAMFNYLEANMEPKLFAEFKVSALGYANRLEEKAVETCPISEQELSGFSPPSNTSRTSDINFRE